MSCIPSHGLVHYTNGTASTTWVAVQSAVPRLPAQSKDGRTEDQRELPPQLLQETVNKYPAFPRTYVIIPSRHGETFPIDGKCIHERQSVGISFEFSIEIVQNGER